MLRRTRRVLFLLFALLASAHLGIEEVRAQDDDIVPAHQFLIRNKSRHKAVLFSLRKGLGPWRDYRLGPGENQLYEDNDQVWFSPEGQAPIHREVKLGKRYKFIFDGAQWDFVMIDPDEAGDSRRRARQRGALRRAAQAGECERTARCQHQHPGDRFRLRGAGARLRDRLEPHCLVPAVWLAAVGEFDRFASVRASHAAP